MEALVIVSRQLISLGWRIGIVGGSRSARARRRALVMRRWAGTHNAFGSGL